MGSMRWMVPVQSRSSGQSAWTVWAPAGRSPGRRTVALGVGVGVDAHRQGLVALVHPGVQVRLPAVWGSVGEGREEADTFVGLDGRGHGSFYAGVMATLHMRFVRFDPDTRTYRPVPDGSRVDLMDADLFSADDLLDEQQTEGGQVVLSIPDTGRPDIYARITEPDDTTWTTQQRFSEDGTPGLMPDFTPADLGSAQAPLTFAASLDVHVVFSVWHDESGWQPVPAGVGVVAIEHDALGLESVVAQGLTDGEGRVSLLIDDPGEQHPDLTIRLLDGPDHGLPADWDSGDHAPLDAPGQLGAWWNLAAATLGTPDSPIRFSIGPTHGLLHTGNTAWPLIDGVDLLAAFEAALSEARHTVHLEMMLFFDDPMGQRIADALIATAERGVRVRMLVDVGTTQTIHQLVRAERLWAKHLRTLEAAVQEAMLARYDALAPEEKARGRIEALMARLADHENITLIDSSFALIELIPDLPDTLPAAYRQLETALPWLTTARVDHRKILIIDGHTALMGGQNIGQEYLYEQPFDPEKTAEEEAWHKWHDCSVGLRGPVVGDLQRLFRERWVSEGGDAFGTSASESFPPLPAEPGGVPVRILRTTPGAIHDFEQGFLAAVAAATQRILIATPYLSSHTAVAALCAAARRGVETVLVLPDGHNDSVDFHYAARQAYPRLIAAGVAVFEYQRRMNHSKVAVFDDTAWIGSANLNHASFSKHYEVVAVIEDSAFTEDFVARLFDVDLPRSRRIAAEEADGLLDINAAAQLYLQQVVWRLF